MRPTLSLIRGGRYGEPLPKKASSESAPPQKERNLEDSIGGPTPAVRAWLARSPDSPFAHFNHGRVGA